MQATDDVQFGDAKMQRLARHLHNLLDRVLKPIRIAFFAGESAKLAAQDAVVGIVDVTIENVACAVSVFALPHEIGNGPKTIQVLALEKPECIGLGNTLSRDNLLVDVAQFAPLERKTHRNLNPPLNTTSVTVTTRKIKLIK